MKFILFIERGPRNRNITQRGVGGVPYIFQWVEARSRHELRIDSREAFVKAERAIRNAPQIWVILTEPVAESEAGQENSEPEVQEAETVKEERTRGRRKRE